MNDHLEKIVARTEQGIKELIELSRGRTINKTEIVKNIRITCKTINEAAKDYTQLYKDRVIDAADGTDFFDKLVRETNEMKKKAQDARAEWKNYVQYGLKN